ncbi:nickel/cobalt efflux transporter [Ancylobacter pratisalsi]|uniref:Nickel/cobalt efflux system n=1 Tax=Ancylobacter pratisalsi TaxID=1745854 RepID=A0A6P1YP50_9HYPH|nr:nickel/cobalt efflux transporter [Ancylobacter pratisalsi]QIB34845.1 nickel/cobalt efflux transporter RcnA [Ancylobacter pratisalsi]
MPTFAELIQQSTTHAWLFIPSAILLGALHGLEPGHSKTMMAAFIVAVRGTVTQAVLLGLAATVSHTMVVWAIALGGMYLWQGIAPETFEPYLQFVSAVIIIAMASWMLWRTHEDQQRAKAALGHDHGAVHDHGHDHDHDHGHEHGHAASDVRMIDTGHGLHKLELHDHGHGDAHWRFRPERGKPWAAGEVKLTTERADGRVQSFAFAERGDYIESVEAIPAPFDFMVRLALGHGNHSHDFDVSFLKSTEGHDHLHEELRGLDVGTDGYQDAHELAHANDIRRRFADREVTTWQIVLFGLTGGLIPCPAAITVLLLCLQLKELSLGFGLVLCFSIGLAITLVAVGAVAALSVRHATKRWSWFSGAARRAPYLSGALLVAVGLYVGWHGYSGIRALNAAPTAALAAPYTG